MAWAPDYVTVPELAAFLRITDTQDDAQLTVAISAASRAIDRAAGRQFGRVDAPEIRIYTARWSGRRAVWLVPIDDLMDDTGFTFEFDRTGTGDFEAVTGYTLRPFNAAPHGRPWEIVAVEPTNPVQLTGRAGAVRLTGTWGWTTVPEPVKEACLLQASRFFARREAPFGVAGSPDAGSETRLLAKVDPDVSVSLQAYRRVVVA